MKDSDHMLLLYAADTGDVTVSESCKYLRCCRVVSPSWRMCAKAALATMLVVAVSYRFGHTTEDEFVGKSLDSLDRAMSARAQNMSPLHHASLDSTTLGKPSQVGVPRQASSLLPSSRPLPSSHLSSRSSLLFRLLPHHLPPHHSRSESTLPWAIHRPQFRMDASLGRNVQVKALDMSIPTMLQDPGVGIVGRWKEVAGNFVIYPKDIESNPPRGIIHFLGGAFVGAAPHFTYRYLLGSLCDQGYIVVTTPYRLQFNYNDIYEGILSKFDVVNDRLAGEFGVLPVIGVGHSCGALMQTLITSKFPEARAANVLISFNNKPATDAIPNFEDVVQPISQTIMGTSTSGQVEGAAAARQAIAAARNAFDTVLDGLSTSDLAPPIVQDELVPVVKQSLEVVDQVPDLLASIAAGTTEFTPTPEETREIVRTNYRANRTFIIQFDNDGIDESPVIERTLLEAKRQSNTTMEVDLKTIGGTHVTPLTQNVILEPPELPVPDPLSPLRQQVRDNFLQTVNEVKTLIVQWLAQK